MPLATTSGAAVDVQPFGDNALRLTFEAGASGMIQIDVDGEFLTPVPLDAIAALGGGSILIPCAGHHARVWGWRWAA